MWYCLFLTITQNEIHDFLLRFELSTERVNYQLFIHLFYAIFPVPQDQDNEQLETDPSVYPVPRLGKTLFTLHLQSSLLRICCSCHATFRVTSPGA